MAFNLTVRLKEEGSIPQVGVVVNVDLYDKDTNTRVMAPVTDADGTLVSTNKTEVTDENGEAVIRLTPNKDIETVNTRYVVTINGVSEKIVMPRRDVFLSELINREESFETPTNTYNEIAGTDGLIGRSMVRIYRDTLSSTTPTNSINVGAPSGGRELVSISHLDENGDSDRDYLNRMPVGTTITLLDQDKIQNRKYRVAADSIENTHGTTAFTVFSCVRTDDSGNADFSDGETIVINANFVDVKGIEDDVERDDTGLSDRTPVPDSETGDPGTGTKPPRDDHSHPINHTHPDPDIPAPSNDIPQQDSEDGSAGTDEEYSRGDHEHPKTAGDIPTPSDDPPQATGTASSPGTSNKYSRGDHTHEDSGGSGGAGNYIGKIEISPSNIAKVADLDGSYQITLSDLNVDYLTTSNVNEVEFWFKDEAIHELTSWTPKKVEITTVVIDTSEETQIALTSSDKVVEVRAVFRNSGTYVGEIGTSLTIAGEDTLQNIKEGDNITIDRSKRNEITINSTGGGGGDFDMQGVMVSTIQHLNSTLTAQETEDEGLIIEFGATIVFSGTTYNIGDIAFVPPRSSSIERLFNKVSHTDLGREARSRQDGDVINERKVVNAATLAAELRLHNNDENASVLVIEALFTTSTRTYRAGDRYYLAPAHNQEGNFVLIEQNKYIGRIDITPSNIAAKEDLDGTYQVVLSDIDADGLKEKGVNQLEIWFNQEAIHALSWSPVQTAIIDAVIDEREETQIALGNQKVIPVFAVFRKDGIYIDQVGTFLTIGGKSEGTAPTKSDVYPIVKEIFVDGDNTTVSEDDTKETIAIDATGGGEGGGGGATSTLIATSSMTTPNRNFVLSLDDASNRQMHLYERTNDDLASSSALPNPNTGRGYRYHGVRIALPNDIYYSATANPGRMDVRVLNTTTNNVILTGVRRNPSDNTIINADTDPTSTASSLYSHWVATVDFAELAGRTGLQTISWNRIDKKIPASNPTSNNLWFNIGSAVPISVGHINISSTETRLLIFPQNRGEGGGGSINGFGDHLVSTLNPTTGAISDPKIVRFTLRNSGDVIVDVAFDQLSINGLYGFFTSTYWDASSRDNQIITKYTYNPTTEVIGTTEGSGTARVELVRPGQGNLGSFYGIFVSHERLSSIARVGVMRGGAGSTKITSFVEYNYTTNALDVGKYNEILALPDVFTSQSVQTAISDRGIPRTEQSFQQQQVAWTLSDDATRLGHYTASGNSVEHDDVLPRNTALFLMEVEDKDGKVVNRSFFTVGHEYDEQVFFHAGGNRYDFEIIEDFPLLSTGQVIALANINVPLGTVFKLYIVNLGGGGGTASTPAQQIALLNLVASPAGISFRSADELTNAVKAIDIQISNPELLTGDVWVEGWLQGQRGLDRTKWTSATSALRLTFNDTTASAISAGVIDDRDISLSLRFFSVASGGSEIERRDVFIPISRIGRPPQSLVFGTASQTSHDTPTVMSATTQNTGSIILPFTPPSTTFTLTAGAYIIDIAGTLTNNRSQATSRIDLLFSLVNNADNKTLGVSTPQYIRAGRNAVVQVHEEMLVYIAANTVVRVEMDNMAESTGDTGTDYTMRGTTLTFFKIL